MSIPWTETSMLHTYKLAPNLTSFEEPRRFYSEDQFKQLVFEAIKHDCSDVLIQPNTPVLALIRGHLKALTNRKIDVSEVMTIIEWASGRPTAKTDIVSGRPVDSRYEVFDQENNKNERGEIIGKNLRHKSHPYYTEYQPLQCLCLQILRMEEVKYGETDEEICGILFDGAWLWEEYLNTILQKEGFRHPENKKHKGGIYLFEDHSGIRYPDFYKDDIVLDAKYKKLESYEKVSKVNRNDLHQLITYITNLQATKGVFIAPLSEIPQKIPKSRPHHGGGRFHRVGVNHGGHRIGGVVEAVDKFKAQRNQKCCTKQDIGQPRTFAGSERANILMQAVCHVD